MSLSSRTWMRSNPSVFIFKSSKSRERNALITSDYVEKKIVTKEVSLSPNWVNTADIYSNWLLKLSSIETDDVTWFYIIVRQYIRIYIFIRESLYNQTNINLSIILHNLPKTRKKKTWVHGTTISKRPSINGTIISLSLTLSKASLSAEHVST